MTDRDFRIQRRAQECSVTGEPFAPGEAVVSAIYEGEEGFDRRDMREEQFDTGSRPFCFWRSRVPEPEEKEARLDYDLALEFLDRLLHEGDPERQGLIYALTLLLSRKRRVRIKLTRRDPEGDILTVLVPRAEDDELIEVRAPRLDQEQVVRLQGDLGQLFGFEVGADPRPGPDSEADGNQGQT